MPDIKDEHEDQTCGPAARFAGGKFYDLLQWKSGKGAKPVTATSRTSASWKAARLWISANGKQSGDTWTVTFAREASRRRG